jgi:hypothetical protein
MNNWEDHWWNNPDGGKLKYLEKNLSQCHFVHNKSQMDWPGIVLRHLLQQVGD